MADSDIADLRGATADRYEIQYLIGEGGMGAVYLATHRQLGSKVAIKILPPEVRLNAGRLARFKREASVSAQLSHPNLVPVFELEVRGDLAYLVMPYIDGMTLEAHLEHRRQMDYAEVRQLIGDIGAALAYAHRRGVVHRDIKPANLLLEKDTGRWLVTDFGVAHVTSFDETDLTHSEATIGTLAYMAPEQFGSAKEVDGRADLYSLAMVACQAVSGTAPQRDGPTRTAQRLRQARPDIPSTVLRVLAAPLASARDERPPSVPEWIGQLDRAASQRGVKRAALGGAIVALAVAGWIVGPFGTSTPLASVPVIAVMPFSVTGTAEGIDLGTILPRAFVFQLRALRDHRVLEAATAQSAVVQRYGRTTDRDTLLSVAGTIEATQTLIGRAEISNDTLSLRVEVYDTARRSLLAAREVRGPPDSLHALASQLVIEAFAERLAAERIGAPTPALPAGLPAVGAYFQGDRAFRRGAMEAAVQQFDRVIALDSAYAPAYLKRMLARALAMRPTQAAGELSSALEGAERYQDQLDPVSRRILESYTVLLRDGDVRGAAKALRTVVDQTPEAVDAWFLLGIFQFRFPTLAGASYPEARATLQEAVIRDPTFAAAVGLLLQIAINQNDRAGARHHIDQYLALDSTSIRADMVRLADSLVFRPQSTPGILASLPTRPVEVLENLALQAGEMRPAPGGRPVGTEALDAILPRAATAEERSMAFRMRMAVYLGSGQHERAKRFLREAPGMGIPQEERDRWMVMGAVTPAAQLATDEQVAAAAGRLSSARGDPLVDTWLVARWARRFSPDRTILADTTLRSLVGEDTRRAALGQSLLDDLRSLDLLAQGDTAGALTNWDRATDRYDVPEVLFGLVGSLWPLHAEKVRVAAAAGLDEQTLTAAAHFSRMAGFVDQVAWKSVLLAQADAARLTGNFSIARRAYNTILFLFVQADGAGAALRDSIETVVDAMGN